MSLTPEKLKALFGDLGKPTMRGVRKCPQCGTMNGTRGSKCKNKLCNAIFKETERKRPVFNADAVKIVTGSTVQVFSVRLRDKGTDYRGFVQLPLVQDIDGNPAENVDPAILAQAAKCYVDTCNRNDRLAAQQGCVHIKGAIACEQEAQPLTLKNSVLNSLQVPNEMKQAIWLLATETTGPLVQRITKNVMVVKCKPNPKHPLGFLHFIFYESNKNKSQPEYKFLCTCKSYRSQKTASCEDNLKRCVHFYACICAFASDERLTDEFSNYINIDIAGSLILDTETDDFIGLMTSAENGTVIPDETTITTVDDTSVEVIIDEETLLVGHEEQEVKRAKLDLEETVSEVILGTSDSLAQASSALLTLQEGTTVGPMVTGVTTDPSPKKTSPSKQTTAKTGTSSATTTPSKKPLGGPVTPADEGSTILSFHEWLASVTERVNQTMHYQFDGSPDPLVFHASQKFFDCMQQRISAGNKKRRLPNSTTGFIRRDALPLGLFTKYTWHITNILHVKQIFDTAEMPLEITRSFVENRDGTFDLYQAPTPAVDSTEIGGHKQTPIRPFELKTYLKVGNTAPDQKEPTPFVIEWIPDILPHSRIGELRIKFEYGHQRNGQIEYKSNHALPIEIQPL